MARPVLLLSTMMAVVVAESVTPVTKVLQLMGDLQAKIVAEGEAAQKLYEEAAELCEDQSKDLQFNIKTGKSDIEELTAAVDRETAKIGALDAKVEELTGIMAESESSLKAATQVRNKEASDFGAEEKELTDIISMLTRAIGILEKELGKGSAAMLQFKNADSIASALNVLVDAFAFRSADAATLTALVQSAQSGTQSSSEDLDEEDEGVGAPAGAVIEKKGGTIVSTMEELLEKADGQLSDARNAETKSRQSFDMLKQSIEDENGFGKKDFEKAQKGLSAAKGKKSNAEGDLSMTHKQVKEDTKALDDLHTACMSKAQDYEASVKSRTQEMHAITDAKKLLSESVGGADEQTYGSASFLQVSRSETSGPQHVVRIVRDLALKQHSRVLMQLSQRMSATFSSQNGADPFAKVKGLITDMISKLEDQGDAEASHKAYCDKEMAETKEKEEDKTTDIESLTTKIDQMNSAVSKLKGQIRDLSNSLSELATAQSEADKLRSSENAEFVKVKADLEEGVNGVQAALKVLKEYYASDDSDDHGAASGAGAGITGLLEVIESDFSQGLAEAEANEESAASTYKQETDENQVETVSKQQDVKYKTQEVTSLEKQIADAQADRTGTQSELDAVNEYKASLVKQCVAKPESYDERKGRRTAEIAGLKDALSTLEGQALLQQSSRRMLRVGKHHALRATL